ncbi:MAG: rhodanese-like domain-containing protein [Cytophagales bacterium]|nr:rhodanese-like domain-containing protein [Cytophaga sp.]
MISFIKKILGIGTSTDFSELIKNGAVIIDVRTKNEYQKGHIKDSINIPLDILQNNLFKFKKDSVVITCCASGMRSGAAKIIFISNGYTQVYNGGGWNSLENKINS